MTLIQALQKPALFPHPVEKFEIIETHLSWVLLTGPFAYKIKKPVNLGIQDFTTLEKRKYYCEQEIFLNQRLAPQIYLAVVAISGSLSQPQFNNTAPIEYAVKMKQFPQKSLLNVLAYEDRLTQDILEQIAKQLVDFHQSAQISGKETSYGEPAVVFSPMQENFSVLKSLLEKSSQLTQMQQIEKWTQDQFSLLKPLLATRKAQGFVRACHGDLHLGNIALYQGAPLIFDCIEFNENLRWTDVMNDVSFLAMDLDHFYLPGLKNIFVNRYFELTGDYIGAILLKFYQCYRAVVRAKVTAFQLKQIRDEMPRYELLQEDLNRLLSLAQNYTLPQKLSLTITCGLSGSGKTLYTKQLLLKNQSSIRLRSDVIRKKSHGLDPYQPTPPALIPTLYHPQTTEKLYVQLRDYAQILLQAGLPVIIDATCLTSGQRALFMTLANNLQVSFQILYFECSVDKLKNRLAHRLSHHSDPSDADEKIFDLQSASLEMLSLAEKKFTTIISSDEIDHLIQEGKGHAPT